MVSPKCEKNIVVILESRNFSHFHLAKIHIVLILIEVVRILVNKIYRASLQVFMLKLCK